MPTTAKVLVDGPQELTLDYAVPAPLEGAVLPGARVQIKLRGRSARGTVLDIIPPSDKPSFKLVEIVSVDGGGAVLPPQLLKLARWISDYYLAPLHSVVRTMVPQPVWKGGMKTKTHKVVSLVKKPSTEELATLERRAPVQAEVLRSLIGKADDEPVAIGDLPIPRASALGACQRIEKNGFVKISEVEEGRDPWSQKEYVRSPPLTLNEEQEVAFAAIVGAMDAKDEDPAKPILLNGVTGSGKTEVYLQAIAVALERGQSAIVLVPEISLTPQTVGRLKGRFFDRADEVSVLHSQLSAGERHDEWEKVRRGHARIVIGARSCIFAPLTNLGLIIVDEEHDSSYKQENQPRYHARDMAVLRAHFENAAVVLASATPSLESHQNSLTGRYDKVHLTTRADGAGLPYVEVADLRTSIRGRKEDPGAAIISPRLRQGIEERLAKKEQVILFLNRRGWSKSAQCPACGIVVMCPHCSLSLTYHRSTERLLCHICGHATLPPKVCPDCGDPSIKFAGVGTQRIEEAISRIFRGSKVARIDADSVSRKDSLEFALDRFRAGKTDILIGTQMIAKGLHFPNVTLVGVLHADLGLHINDFRAAERTFQLLTQVAGRAGRGEMKGEVIFQTFSPESPAIQFARRQDFEGFAEQELAFRKQLGFPPFSHALLAAARGTHEARTALAMETFARRLRPLADSSGIVMGVPGPAPLAKAADEYRFQLLLRGKRARTLQAAVREASQGLEVRNEIAFYFDMDPYNLG